MTSIVPGTTGAILRVNKETVSAHPELQEDERVFVYSRYAQEVHPPFALPEIAETLALALRMRRDGSAKNKE